jgi:hypothetical protein
VSPIAESLIRQMLRGADSGMARAPEPNARPMPERRNGSNFPRNMLTKRHQHSDFILEFSPRTRKRSAGWCSHTIPGHRGP